MQNLSDQFQTVVLRLNNARSSHSDRELPLSAASLRKGDVEPFLADVVHDPVELSVDFLDESGGSGTNGESPPWVSHAAPEESQFNLWVVHNAEFLQGRLDLGQSLFRHFLAEFGAPNSHP